MELSIRVGLSDRFNCLNTAIMIWYTYDMRIYCKTCGCTPFYDEWASKTTCIDCGPLEENTDSSKGIEESVIKGEKDVPLPLF